MSKNSRQVRSSSSLHSLIRAVKPGILDGALHLHMPSLTKDVGVLVQIRQNKLGKTALADSEQVPRPPGLQIFFGDIETV